jgi:alpha-amylase/alpha-mannosidase (GH57 family)
MGNVCVSLLWHHHQPYYREGPNERHAMPWVRLHGIKDYYGMAWLAQQHPEVHLTFNLVPSLLVQLQDYASGEAQEEWLRLTARPARELEEREVHFILNEFFCANWDTMVRPHPRYYELLMKRRFDRRTAAQAASEFSRQDLLDLQVWATLAWFFPQLHWDDEVLRELVAKGRNFTEDDKAALLAKQREVLGRIIPMYRELQERGNVELSVSPFYHPILPLLCKMERAREAIPGLPMPRTMTDLSDDARAQVARAVEAYWVFFGRAPRGMWPSEGAVSAEVPPLVAEAGIRWIATDEGILCRSLGCALHRDERGGVQEWQTLYQPYRVPAGGSELSIVFRDRYISDLIGFQYYNQSPEAAAADLLQRLTDVGSRTGGKDVLIPLILDGENAWEYYKDSGIHFLHALYGRLASTPGIQTVTVSEYLGTHPPRATLGRLFAGSWINSDFGVWIGHAEDRRGWELLAQTRQFLASRSQGKAPAPEFAQAWEEMYIAEGSDWFWWYGDDRSSLQDAEFDRLFRRHLQNVYRLLGEPPPEVLDEPIARVPGRAPFSRPTAFAEVEVDGRVTNFFEWSTAGVYQRELDAGVMDNETPEHIRSVHFGFNERELYLRIDCGEPFAEAIPASGRLVVCFTEPRDIELEIDDLRSARPRVRLAGMDSRGGRAAAAEVLEAACPFKELGFRPREAVRFHVRLLNGDAVLERAPRAGHITFEVPTRDFEREMWQV